VPVRFSDTVLYGAEVLHPDSGRPVHVLGYQNRVQGQVGPSSPLSWLPWGGSGNAMILPFPARPGSMTRANVVDTSGYKDVLQDVADAIPRTVEDDAGDEDDEDFDTPQRRPPEVQVFDAAGIYTVVLADNPRDIPAALGQVPRSKRPTLNPALFDAYARWYPGWTVALCCFNTRRARLAQPLLWWYEPLFPDRLFLPALDDHAGSVPDLSANVLVNHVVAVTSYRLQKGYPVSYRDDMPAVVAPYLRPSVLGKQYDRRLPNGDFVCDLDRLAAGRFTTERKPPLAA
jgi:hypothetical protein